MIFCAADAASTLSLGYVELGPDDTNHQQWNLITSPTWLTGASREDGAHPAAEQAGGQLSDYFIYYSRGPTRSAGNIASTFTMVRARNSFHRHQLLDVCG